MARTYTDEIINAKHAWTGSSTIVGTCSSVSSVSRLLHARPSLLLMENRCLNIFL